MWPTVKAYQLVMCSHGSCSVLSVVDITENDSLEEAESPCSARVRVQGQRAFGAAGHNVGEADVRRDHM